MNLLVQYFCLIKIVRGDNQKVSSDSDEITQSNCVEQSAVGKP